MKTTLTFSNQKAINKAFKSHSNTVGGVRSLFLSLCDELGTNTDIDTKELKKVVAFLRASKKDNEKYEILKAAIKPTNRKSIETKGALPKYSIWSLLNALRSLDL
jgi:hypothetical protein